MNSPTPNLVGNVGEGGGAPAFAVLDPWVQEMEDCPNCGPQIVVFAWQAKGGLVGCCLGCGQRREMPFTRAISEVA